MAGRFEGISDLEWRLFEDIFPREPKKRDRITSSSLIIPNSFFPTMAFAFLSTGDLLPY